MISEHWVIRGLRVALATVALLGGMQKLEGADSLMAVYAGWGLPDWFARDVGVVEVAAGASLLWVATARIGAWTLAGLQLGGIVARLTWGELQGASLPTLILVMAMLVAGRSGAATSERSVEDDMHLSREELDRVTDRYGQPFKDTSFGPWVARIVVGLVFLFNGLVNVSGWLHAERSFLWLGLGDVPRIIVGVIEIVAAILLMIPGAGLIGASLLLLVLLPALVLRVANGNWPMAFITAFFVAVCAWLAESARRHQPWTPDDPIAP